MQYLISSSSNATPFQKKLLSPGTLLYVGFHDFRKQAPQQEPHIHTDVTEFLYFSEGSGSCVIDEKEYAVNAGDLVVYNAGTTHVDNFGQLFFCGATDILIKGLPTNHFLSSDQAPVIHAGPPGAALQSILTSLNQIAATEQSLSYNACQLLYQSFLYQILELQCLQDSDPSTKASHQAVTLRKGQQIREYVDAHITASISLKEIAEYFNTSTSYVSRVFKQITGCTLTKYQEQHRVGLAQTLLLTTTFSMADIARQVGYSNQQYFSKQFLDITGFTPTQYRKRFGGS